MGRRVAIFFVLVLLLLLHLGKGVNPTYLFFVAPFLFLFTFYLFILNDRISAVAVIVFSLVLFIYEGIRSNNVNYFISVPVLAFSLLVVRRYQNVWNRKIEGIEIQKQEMQKETKDE